MYTEENKKQALDALLRLDAVISETLNAKRLEHELILKDVQKIKDFINNDKK